MTKKEFFLTLICSVVLFALAQQNAVAADNEKKVDGERIQMQEIFMGSPKVAVKETVTERVPNLTTEAIMTAKKIKNFNAINIEDTVRYLPNLFVRKRFIGDPNAVISIRGNSNFQTARQMVFTDGFALHNLLQSRFNGSPRWNVVAPEEVESTQVIYGPFSAAYSGNAMGGIVNIKTKKPQKREVKFKTSYFFQDYSLFGTSDTFHGYNTHVSYGDKIDKLSFFVFYDRLENSSHPQSLRSDNTLSDPAGETVASGVFRNNDVLGSDQIIYGDSGSEKVEIDLFKVKANYEFNSNLSARGIFAYVNRDRETSPNNYLRNAMGNTIWGGNAQFDGRAFNIRRSHFAVDKRQKQDILVGTGIEGKLGDGWEFDASMTYFNIIEDERRQSNVNPDDPTFNGSGRITEFDDSGWQTADIKFANESFHGNPDVSFFAGYHFAHYDLNVSQHNTNEFRYGDITTFRNGSGGDTRIHAVFFQTAWQFLPQWKASFGGRQEWWSAYNGFNDRGNGVVATPDRKESAFSPKFSLEYKPDDLWTVQFSLAKAYRFPIVEELFQNIQTQNSTSLSDADLKEEDGFHKSFMIQRKIKRGDIKLTFFEDEVDDTIFNFQDVTDPMNIVSGVLNIDAVRTRGIEFAFTQDRVFDSDFDFLFNTSYIDSEITENSRRPDSVGDRMPRVPEWRVNLLSTYHVNKAWDASVGLRYASSAFNTIPSNDIREGFGSQSDFLVVDLKSSYRWDNGITASFGIDNVNDDEYFVFHPMPQRTFIFGLEWDI